VTQFTPNPWETRGASRARAGQGCSQAAQHPAKPAQGQSPSRCHWADWRPSADLGQTTLGTKPAPTGPSLYRLEILRGAPRHLKKTFVPSVPLRYVREPVQPSRLDKLVQKHRVFLVLGCRHASRVGNLALWDFGLQLEACLITFKIEGRKKHCDFLKYIDFLLVARAHAWPTMPQN